jgi:large subunit ribosomal protein L19
MDHVRLHEKPMLRTDLPRISVGDTLAVSLKIKEGDKERTQIFRGTVIGIRGGGLGETFTMRRLVAGEGVERILPLHSPLIAAIEIVSKGRVRRAKLRYLRNRSGKGTRLTTILGEEGHGDSSPAAAGKASEPKAAEAKTAAPKAERAAPAKK